MPHKGIYHCFGCGEGGDVFKFVEKTRGIPFAEVVRELGQSVGVVVEERQLSEGERRQLRARASLYEVCDLAADWFHANLMTRPEGRPARDYLKGRGMSAQTVEKYRLGFAPESWDGLLNHLHRKGISAELAVKAGLAGPARARAAPRPLPRPDHHPHRRRPGACGGLGGRVLPGADGDAPRYELARDPGLQVIGALRPPPRPGGRPAAAAAARRRGLLRRHQPPPGGLPGGRATCGTSLTAEHARTVRPLTRTVIALFDGDEAGERAAARSLEVFLQAGIEPRRLSLPNAKDPDEFVQEFGADAFEQALDRSEPLFELLLRRTQARFGATPGGRAAVLHELAPVVRLFSPRRGSRWSHASAARCGWTRGRSGRSWGGRARANPDGPCAAAAVAGNGRANHLLWLMLHHPARVAHVLTEVTPGS